MKKNQSTWICKIYNIYNWTNTYDAACRPFCKYAFFQWCGKLCGILAILYLYLVCVACCFQHLSANAAMLPSLHCGPAIQQPLLKQLQRETLCNIAPYKHALNSCGTCLGISMMLPRTPCFAAFSVQTFQIRRAAFIEANLLHLRGTRSWTAENFMTPKCSRDCLIISWLCRGFTAAESCLCRGIATCTARLCKMWSARNGKDWVLRTHVVGYFRLLEIVHICIGSSLWLGSLHRMAFFLDFLFSAPHEQTVSKRSKPCRPWL